MDGDKVMHEVVKSLEHFDKMKFDIVLAWWTNDWVERWWVNQIMSKGCVFVWPTPCAFGSPRWKQSITKVCKKLAIINIGTHTYMGGCLRSNPLLTFGVKQEGRSTRWLYLACARLNFCHLRRQKELRHLLATKILCSPPTRISNIP